jgi:hypothetical protein
LAGCGWSGGGRSGGESERLVTLTAVNEALRGWTDHDRSHDLVRGTPLRPGVGYLLAFDVEHGHLLRTAARSGGRGFGIREVVSVAHGDDIPAAVFAGP